MNVDDVFNLVADTLKAHGVPCDRQFGDTIWFDDTENDKTWCIGFNECDRYEGK